MPKLEYVPRHREPEEEEADAFYKQQRAENERLKALERDAKLRKMRGELIERGQCLRQASSIMVAVRQRLMLVPTLAARSIKPGTSQHDARFAIDKEIRAALSELADFPEKVTGVGRWKERKRK